MVVPGSMSPQGKTISNGGLWSMSVQFDKQVANAIMMSLELILEILTIHSLQDQQRMPLSGYLVKGGKKYSQ